MLRLVQVGEGLVHDGVGMVQAGLLLLQDDGVLRGFVVVLSNFCYH